MDFRSAATEKCALQYCAAGGHRAALHTQFVWTDVQPVACGVADRPAWAEWWVRSSRVEDAVTNSTTRVISGQAERIAIPADIRQLCQTQPRVAEEMQSGVR